jgi:two-component system sensor histidine kinase KdpD
MMKNRQRQKDTLFSILIFCSAFAVNLLIQKLFTTQTLVPMIFVFGVFLISLKTHGYCYGITSAIVSVFAVNFAFTKSGLVLHTDYGAMSIYSCAL